MSKKSEVKGYLAEHLKNTGLTYNMIAKKADIPIGTARSALQGSSSSYESAAKIAKYVLNIPFFGLFLSPEEVSNLGNKISSKDEVELLKQFNTLEQENIELKKEVESYHQELRYLVNKVRTLEEQFEAYKNIKSK